MKLNELVCPNCGLKCLTDADYTTCASCQYLFYACQSRSVKMPPSLTGAIVIGPITPPPPMPWIGTPWPGTGSITVSTGGMVDSTGVVVQAWN